MPEQANKFSRRSNDNLLQLWTGRDQLPGDDIDPLRNEILSRGLSKEVEEICQQPSAPSIYGKLPSAPQTYLKLSVAFWWLRELWLRYKTREGRTVEATITIAQRTGSGILLRIARTELLYSYEFQGRQYAGRVVRDFSSTSNADADSLAYNHHPGEILPITINPDNPEISYYPSGLGSVQPILVGFQSLLLWALIIGLIRLVILSILPKT